MYYVTHGTHHSDQLTVWQDTMPGVDCVPISVTVEALGSFKKKQAENKWKPTFIPLFSIGNSFG